MKKDVPLDLLAQFELIVGENLDILDNIKEENTYYSLRDKDELSTFFFKVYMDGSKHISNYNKESYVYEWRPNNTKKTSKAIFQGSIQDIIEQLKGWIKLIREYNNISSINDGNFEKMYEDNFYEEFQIVDEDAEINPFDVDRQIFIFKFLQNIINKLELENKQELHPIIEDAIELQNNLPKQTKKIVIRKLSKILAKIQKHGIGLLLEFYDIAKKELMKKVLNGGLHEVGGLIDQII